MSKIKWLLAIMGGAALVSAVSVQAVAASTSAVSGRAAAASASSEPATIFRFDTMAPVTGPYVGAASPVRGVPGGGLPWMIISGRASLNTDGDLQHRGRGQVLAGQHTVR